MAEKIVYLIRHGLIRSNMEEIYSGRSEERLTERGAQEAHELGREMVEWGIRIIYTSPLARTVQTAQILNEYVDAQVVVEPDLIEMDLGPWSGLSKIEVARKYPSEYQTWCERPGRLRAMGMETLQDVQQRTLRALDAFLKAGSENVVAMVTHAVVVKCALLHLNGLPLNVYHGFQVQNLSVHQAVFKEGKGVARMIRKGSGPVVD